MGRQTVVLYSKNEQTIEQIKDAHGIRSNAAAIRLALNHWAKTYTNGKHPHLKHLAEAYFQGHMTAEEFAREAGLLILSGG